ncbi:MAG: ACP S-malonyltransferase [Saprospiraceae bacterium]|nr:ACP S-malonyltransferase [Candidatus Vicinibacter affinis]MBK7799518.1 ACP S-malonyltransferase [Candidatus Vicinibacter affinis]MBP6173190.1 ACP S-malonyltransferase [Saprospiraceae bacterium]MBP6522706.1 ACP S-malonyltransferase [Saprospiraceae bacterium]
MLNKAYIFPGQASQYRGMGKDLYESSDVAKSLFEQANDFLGFRISDIMFEGTDDELKQTHITQPSVFIHSIVKLKSSGNIDGIKGMAGHSLGEFSALVASGVISFEAGLSLVRTRALAMQEACDLNPGSMAAIVGLSDEQIEEVCASINEEIVVPANYNCPGQLVISGSLAGLQLAEKKLMEIGAKRFILLAVGGAFHSPLMEPAREKLAAAIDNTTFSEPICAIYQNVDACPYSDPTQLKRNLNLQLTSPVKWTQTMQNMIADQINHFTEVGGNGTVLSGFLKRIDRNIPVETL